MSSKIAVDFRPGHRGCRTVKTGTDAHTAAADGHSHWSEIQILVDDTEFDVITDETDAGESLVGTLFNKGEYLYGYFTAVTRAAGEYRLHKGP